MGALRHGEFYGRPVETAGHADAELAGDVARHGAGLQQEAISSEPAGRREQHGRSAAAALVEQGPADEASDRSSQGGEG